MVVNYIQTFLWCGNKVRRLLIAALATISVGILVNIFTPIFMQKLVYELGSNGCEDRRVLETLLIVLFLQACQGIGSIGLLSVLQSRIWISMEKFIHKAVELQFFSKLTHKTLDWTRQHNPSELFGCIDRGASAVCCIFELSLFNIIPTLINIITTTMVLSSKFGNTLSLIVVTQTCVFVWITITHTEKRRKKMLSLNLAEDAVSSKATEVFLNFQTVKLMNAENLEVQKFSRALDFRQEGEAQVLGSLNWMYLVQTFLLYSGLAFGTFIILFGETKGDGILLFLTHMSQLYHPLNYLGRQYAKFRSCLMNIKYVLEIIHSGEEELIVASQPVLQEGIVQDCLELRNVSFSYDTRNDKLLYGVSVKFFPGKVVALVGPSGAAKSTVLSLLTKLYTNSEGDILFDGIPSTKINTTWLRSQIAFVPQDTVIMSDTIGNNIRYAKPEATDSEIVLAAEKAEIHENIMTLPLKYETILGAGSANVLSGGEKQRISLARMFLKDSPILLLDEPTSALDQKNKNKILDTLLCLGTRTGKIVIIVTHDPDVMKKVDEAFAIRNGKITKVVEKSNRILYQNA